MIVAAAFVPGSPLLVSMPRTVAPDPVIAGLRSAAAAAVEHLAAAGTETLLVLGTGPRSQLFSPVAEGTLIPWGLDVTVHLGSPACGAIDPLPLSLTVGAWLMREAFGPSSGARGVACTDGFGAGTVAAQLLGLATASRVGLLVVADGAERFPPLDGPGHTAAEIAEATRLADRLDQLLAEALAAGDGDALAALAVPPTSVRLASLPAWRAAGSLLAGAGISARLNFRDSSHGVGWLVAQWMLDD